MQRRLVPAALVGALAFCLGGAACMDGAGGDGETGARLPFDVESVLYPGQPMIVDLVVRGAPDGVLDLAIVGEPTPHWRELDSSGDTRRLRVRGLRPSTDYVFELNAASGTLEQAVSTHDPLPGFVEAFDVQAEPGLEGEGLRLFDLGRQGVEGVFLVDRSGKTRWYLGGDTPPGIPEPIWAGVRLRDDGTVSFLREGAAVVVDELGTERMRVGGAQLGSPRLHHDLIELPNGHWVALSYAFEVHEYPGLGEQLYAGDTLLEFSSEGDLLWSWNAFDALDTTRLTEPFVDGWPVILTDEGVPAYDWTHGNGVIYDEENDSFLLSLRHQDWLVSIDHASGEVQWRLGPDGDFTLEQGDWFFHQHSPQWQPDGSILLYDNAVNNPGLDDALEHTRAVRFEVDPLASTARRVWVDDSEPFVSAVAGDVDRLENGNFLRLDSFIAGSAGSRFSRIVELDPNATPMVQWTLTPPTDLLSYRCVEATRWVGEGVE